MKATLGPKSRSLAERFWPKVDQTGECWTWTGYACEWTGYGKISNRPGAPVGAHVAGYLIQNGPVTDGLQVLHACDNRICVRGEHLHLGTQAENMREAAMRGRVNPSMLRGEQVGTSRLTAPRVREIKAALAQGELSCILALEHGVSLTTISRIKRGQSWGHI